MPKPIQGSTVTPMPAPAENIVEVTRKPGLDGRFYHLVSADKFANYGNTDKKIIGFVPSKLSGAHEYSDKLDKKIPIIETEKEALARAKLMDATHSSDFNSALANSIASKDSFCSFEIDLLTKLLSKEGGDEKVSEWFHMLMDGKQKEVQVGVQKYINKNIKYKSIAKMAFYKSIQKWKTLTKKQKVVRTAKKIASIPLAPLILLKEAGKTICFKKRRCEVVKGTKALLKGEAKTTYRIKNKLIKGLMKAGTSLAIGSAITAEVLSLGAATPFIIAGASITGATIAGKMALDKTHKKHFALTLAEVLGANVQAACVAGLEVGLGEVTQLSEILLNTLNMTFDDAIDPVGRALEEIGATPGEEVSDAEFSIARDTVDHAFEAHQETLDNLSRVSNLGLRVIRHSML